MQVLVVAMVYSVVMLALTSMGACLVCDPAAPNQCNPGLVKNALATSRCAYGTYNDMATLAVSPNGALLQSYVVITYHGVGRVQETDEKSRWW